MAGLGAHPAVDATLELGRDVPGGLLHEDLLGARDALGVGQVDRLGERAELVHHTHEHLERLFHLLVHAHALTPLYSNFSPI